ncbi:MAG: FAD-dependent oxidoreductase, partial [Pseudomonadota bacterium]
MLRLTEIRLPLGHPADALRTAILQRLKIDASELLGYNIARRAYDARKKTEIVFVYSLDAAVVDEARLLKRCSGEQHIKPTPDTEYKFVARAPVNLKKRPVIIGTGPCGFMAALLLAQMGFKPLILERGREVRQRTKDTWALWRNHRLDPESNVQFGEGGAGTFSDGKLHTQIQDPRHLGVKILREFVKAGAPEEILYVSKPHVGTFRLVSMLEKIREEIIGLGGEFRFESRVTDIDIDAGQVRGVVLAGGERIACDHVILAIGHSARDTFQMLHDRGVYVEAKPFSI